MEVNVAVTQQQWLTAQWDRACATLDAGKTLSDAALATWWQHAELFLAVEASLRRSGLTGCIHGETAGCREYAVNCTACIGVEYS